MPVAVPCRQGASTKMRQTSTPQRAGKPRSTSGPDGAARPVRRALVFTIVALALVRWGFSRVREVALEHRV